MSLQNSHGIASEWRSAKVDGYTLYFRESEHEKPAREVYGWLKSHRKLIHGVGQSLDGIMWSLLVGGFHRSYMIDHKKRFLVFYG